MEDQARHRGQREQRSRSRKEQRIFEDQKESVVRARRVMKELFEVRLVRKAGLDCAAMCKLGELLLFVF